MNPSISPTVSTALVILRRVAIVIAFVVILLRPGFGKMDAPNQTADVDVLVVLDTTRSMAALDYDGRQPRIDGVKKDLVALSEELPGARFGLVTFGSKARLTLPFSTDVLAFQSAVETVALEGPRDGDGSDSSRAADEISDVLARAEEQRPEQRRFVVFVGDGEDTETDENSVESSSGGASYADIATEISGGTVLGYGTTDGATMPMSEDIDEQELVQDPDTNQAAVSRADPDRLKAIAEQLDVTFHERSGPGGISTIADSFGASYDNGDRDDARQADRDVTWFVGLVLLLLLLFELHAAWRAAWSSQRALLPARSKGAGR
ncbi:MAG: VWA domain-containing protein [Nocardioidaceae bacterium]|nr:VWA domain-containing protein [Nocardioidaceae bacterium]